MRPWMLVCCLGFVGGAAFGVMKFRSSPLSHYFLPPPPPREHAVQAEEYVVYGAVLDSSELKEKLENVAPCVVRNVTVQRYLTGSYNEKLSAILVPHDPSPDLLSLGVPQEVIADFSIQSTRSYPLTDTPHSRVACRLVGAFELDQPKEPTEASFAFSRVGFNAAMSQAALYLYRNESPNIGSTSRGYSVRLKKQAGRWVVMAVDMVFAMTLG